MIEALQAGIPAYSRPLRGRFGAGIRVGVEEALTQFVDLIENPELDRSGLVRIYRGLGGGEYRERRSLDALLAAYRLGARVSWRRLAETAIAAGVDPEVLVVLAEAVFAYIDEIAALSAEGYATEQLEAAGEAQRRRRRLARLLLEPDQDPEAVAVAASEAGWPEPARLAALVWAGGDGRMRGRLPADALLLEEEGGGIALICDPEPLARPPRSSVPVPGRSRFSGLRSRHARRRGPRTGPAPCSSSPRPAPSTLRPPGWSTATSTSRRWSRTRSPAPSATSPRPGWRPCPARRRRRATGSRARCVRGSTTRARSRRSPPIDVHPQTVRYRMGRLRELFGTAIDDPDTPFELAMALRGYG